MKLSSEDRKDLDKYTKFLALKSAQIIVQSRLGKRISTTCNPQPCKDKDKSDWVNYGFNMHISDLPDVLAETRKVLSGEMISSTMPLCVEISLKTSDGDEMILESWCLSLLPEQCDPTVRFIHSVYNRMGILLKSLVSVTRVTPAYKLSRRQDPDTYIICYRIYMDKQQLHNLGDGYKQVRIGQICTPIGTVQLSLAYRTKMTISPTQAGRDNSIMVKSDHFNTNLSPRNARCKQVDKKIVDMSKPMRPGAFVDAEDVEGSKYVLPPQLPIVTRLLSMGQKKSPKSISGDDEDQESSCLDKNDIVVVQQNAVEDTNGNNIPSVSQVVTTTVSTIEELAKDDQYWMKPLKAPFTDGGPYTELMEFLRLLKAAPSIEPLDESVLSQADVKSQLDVFESKLNEYDQLVESLYQSPDN